MLSGVGSEPRSSWFNLFSHFSPLYPWATAPPQGWIKINAPIKKATTLYTGRIFTWRVQTSGVCVCVCVNCQCYEKKNYLPKTGFDLMTHMLPSGDDTTKPRYGIVVKIYRVSKCKLYDSHNVQWPDLISRPICSRENKIPLNHNATICCKNLQGE
jgi:hypothetical protein